MSSVESEPVLHIIREPKVYLVGRQVVDEEALAAFLADHEVDHWTTDSEVAGEKIIETAGRVCYMSFAKPRPGGNRAYISHILEVGHGSVLEHAVFNLLITGVSRSLTHELVRHRAGFGFSQLSQRFVDESEAEFVEPEVIAEDPELHRIWLGAVQASQAAYRDLADRLAEKFKDLGDRTLRRKKAREAARSVLPNATETKIFVTANARAWRNFIEQRGDVAADAEIRRLAIAVLEILQREAPNLFGDYTLIDLPDGGRAVTTPHRKV
jgi:thymidylate synthase (FAD)